MSEQFLGEIKLISWNYPPKNWAFCNGQLMPINQNQALFSLLGTMYGGDGRVTFALPDLRSRIPLHAGGSYIQGQTGGEEAHTLINQEMSAHVHIPQASSNGPNQGSPANGFWAGNAAAYSNAVNNTMNPALIQPVGGSQPHENMPPYLVINFVIALVGIFPSRN